MKFIVSDKGTANLWLNTYVSCAAKHRNGRRRKMSEWIFRHMIDDTIFLYVKRFVKMNDAPKLSIVHGNNSILRRERH